MNSTIRDVASIAGVAPSTVSRAINKSGYVSQKTLEKINGAIASLGYSPSAIAISLTKSKTKTVGFLVPDICNSFFSEVFYAASKVAEKGGYHIMLINTDDNIQLEAESLKTLFSQRVCGIIMTPISDKDTSNVQLLDMARLAGIPIVFVDREINGFNCDGVFIDNVRASYEAISLLLNNGHRKIAIIAGPQDTIPGRERMTGYQNALRDYGIEPAPDYVAMGNFRTDKSYRATQALLNMPDPPTAIFSCNNLMTIGAIKAIVEAGKRVPDDVALIGFDEVSLLTALGYNITMISRATTEMGTIAMSMLLHRIDGDGCSAYQRVILQSKLNIRGSEKMRQTAVTTKKE